MKASCPSSCHSDESKESRETRAYTFLGRPPPWCQHEFNKPVLLKKKTGGNITNCGSPRLPNVISHVWYWQLLPESSNGDLVCVCRGRFGQHMPVALCFQAVEKPACSAWSDICGTSCNTTLLCCHGPRGTGYFRQNTAWGHLYGGLYWITVIAVVCLPHVHPFTLGNTDINTEIYVQLSGLYAKDCTVLHCNSHYL